MRRLLLIFIAVLLPLQWSWAAAASVCAHAREPAHYGHHEHQHGGADQAHDGVGQSATSADASADSGTNPSPTSHPDCQACHGMAAYPPAPDAAANLWGKGALPFAYGQFLPDPPTQSLLRPPLALVA
jgi:hypothetical protein